MQKIISYSFFSLLIIINVQGQVKSNKSKFILNGHVTGMDHKSMFLSYRATDGNYRTDSSVVVNGKFQFTGSISEPSRALLTNRYPSNLPVNDPNLTWLFIEPTSMQLTVTVGEFKQANLVGSKTQDESAILRKMKADITKMTDPLMKEYDRLNDLYILKKKAKADDTLASISNAMDSIRKRMQPYNDKSLIINNLFFERYPNSFVTVFYLKNSTGNYTFGQLNDYYQKMSLKVQQSQSGQDLKSEIERKVKALPGSPAPNFTAKELSGDTLRLSDYKGKYVLLDFWASWCVPCRAGNPELKRLYSMYKDHGVEFIGIADDDSSPEEWKAAIRKDGTGIWKHVLRGRSEKPGNVNDLHDLYSIQTLPTKILINTEGKVIGRYAEGKEDDERLSKKLQELFQKS